MPVELNDELVNQVFRAIYFQPKDKAWKYVKEIIETGITAEDTSSGCANEICDYLQIERRFNRAAIKEVINPLFSK